MEINCIGTIPAWVKNCRTILIFIFLTTVTQTFAQAPIRVAGTVRDNKGVAISGVTVSLKGGGAATITDSTGAYSLTVPSNKSVLVFSYVGFLPKEQTVGTNQLLNITMAEKTNDLDEVVVIGYGQTQRKSNLTGSISSVNSKQIQERQPINIYDALQ